ncbi:MAG: pyruvate dehydrogenase complex dihydrolipoamide acetyltransferase [Rickettsiales bacterium]
MPIKVLMPALSPTMKEGNLAKWHIKEGDQVNAGDLIAEIETDKATMEVEAVDEGKVGKILIKEGTKNVKVNSTIAMLLEEGEEASSIKDEPKEGESKEENKSEENEDKKSENKKSDEKDSQEGEEKSDQQAKKPEVKVPDPNASKPKEVSTQEGAAPQSRTFASPLAKRMAAESNMDLSKIKGSGPKGRIVKNDVLNPVVSGGGFSMSSGHVSRVQPETSDLPISTMRQVIADRLLESKQNVPHFYLTVDCRMDKLLEMRKDINSMTNPDNPEFKISVNDLIIKASALALKAVPEANSSWGDGSIMQYNNVDVAVAVAIQDGLITPIVRNADQKSIFAISEEMKELIGKAKSGTLSPEEFQGGGFSISNLGMFGIKQFNAIINPPQSCILAVSATEERAVVVDGELSICNMMTITISCDHRVVDGAVGANLINSIKQVIENPVRMMI